MDITSFVEGVQHEIQPDRHYVRLQLTPLTSTGGFVLDDATYGLLDTSEMTY